MIDFIAMFGGKIICVLFEFHTALRDGKPNGVSTTALQIKPSEIVPPKSRATRSYNMPTIQQFITASFENQLQIYHKSGIQPKVGDAVLARMRGYDPWPARIIGLKNKNKNVECYFYGAHNSGSVGSKNIIPFVDAFETVRLVCLRNPKNFVKGIQEIEIEFGVPTELSCLKEFDAIA